MDVIRVIFGKFNENIFEKFEFFQGIYMFIFEINVLKDVSVDLDNVKIIFIGRIYGWFGIDFKGRDLLVGIIWGLRVFFVIGVFVVVFSVFIGIFYGVISVYFGGWMDEMMMRFQEFMVLILSLLIFIFMGMYFGGYILLWQIVLLLVVFGWVGVVRVVRSMVFQIKEQIYVEVVRVLGVSIGRIIFKYMVLQLFFYVFVSMVFGVLGVVFLEVFLSFFGFGDLIVVIWGQIFYDVQVVGVVMNGYWWWVFLFGLVIVFVGFMFVMIGMVFDRVFNLRLRRM